jgi:hypothetical protein
MVDQMMMMSTPTTTKTTMETTEEICLLKRVEETDGNNTMNKIRICFLFLMINWVRKI